MDRILVVDGSNGILDTVKAAIADAEREIHCYVDSEKALRVLQQQSWSLLITATKMPAENGFTLARCASRLTPMVPCILMSDCGSTEELLLSLAMKTFAFLKKPLEANYLKSLVKNALRVAARRQDSSRHHLLQ